MYCSQCGMELPDDAGFCSACGSRVLPDEALRYTVTFLRYDAAGPELTMVLPDGEGVTLTGRDRKSVSLPGGTQTLTLNAGPQQETLEVSLAADTQVDLYWSNEERRFMAVVSTPQPSAEAEATSASAFSSTTNTDKNDTQVRTIAILGVMALTACIAIGLFSQASRTSTRKSASLQTSTLKVPVSSEVTKPPTPAPTPTPEPTPTFSEFPAQEAMDEYEANSVRAEQNYIDRTYWCELKVSSVYEDWLESIRITGTIRGTSLTAEFTMSSSAGTTSISAGDVVCLKGTFDRYGILYDFIFESGSFYN